MLSPRVLYVHLRTQDRARHFLFFYFMFKLKKIYFMSVTNPGKAQVHVLQCATPLDEIMDRTRNTYLHLLKYKFNVTVLLFPFTPLYFG